MRALAVELAINPNTIQKAYTELERLGIITSIPGRGSFIADNVKKLADHNREQLLGELKRTLAEVRDAGVPRGEAERLICLVWNEAVSIDNAVSTDSAVGTGFGKTDISKKEREQ